MILNKSKKQDKFDAQINQHKTTRIKISKLFFSVFILMKYRNKIEQKNGSIHFKKEIEKNGNRCLFGTMIGILFENKGNKNFHEQSKIKE